MRAQKWPKESALCDSDSRNRLTSSKYNNGLIAEEGYMTKIMSADEKKRAAAKMMSEVSFSRVQFFFGEINVWQSLEQFDGGRPSC